MLILTGYTNKETKAKKLQNSSKPVSFSGIKNNFKASAPNAVGSNPLTDLLCDFRQHTLTVFFSVSHINSAILCLFYNKHIKQIKQLHSRLSQTSEDLDIMLFFLTRTSAEGVNIIKPSKATSWS